MSHRAASLPRAQDTFDIRILMAKSVKYTVNFLDTKEEDLYRCVCVFVCVCNVQCINAFTEVVNIFFFLFCLKNRDTLQVPHDALWPGARPGLLV